MPKLGKKNIVLLTDPKQSPKAPRLVPKVLVDIEASSKYLKVCSSIDYLPS